MQDTSSFTSEGNLHRGIERKKRSFNTNRVNINETNRRRVRTKLIDHLFMSARAGKYCIIHEPYRIDGRIPFVLLGGTYGPLID